MRNMGEYHDLYVQSDTIMLADIFGNFRNKCMKIYQLNPAHFLSAPGLTWEACLKKTKIKLELLTDKNILLMFEEGTRGGMCQAIYRYATANNKYTRNYNKNITSSYLEYLDGNNLYGWAMCKKLPVGKFKWSKNLSIYTEQAIKNYDDNNDYGLLLEVDVEYPRKIASKHRNLPFLPERRKINKIEKLVATLEDKERYVIYISALKQALNHRLKLKKVHTVITFRQ